MNPEEHAGTESAPQGALETGTAPPATEAPSFPADTPVSEMSAAQQAAYWKAQSRKHENRAKAVGVTPDEVKRLREESAELARLRQASMTEQERAVAAAKAEAASETAHSFALRLVAAEFRAATAGRMSADDLAATLEPLDLGRFLNDNGDVDADRVNAYADRLAPRGEGNQRRFPDLGQGRREQSAQPSVASGRAAYRARQGQGRRNAV